MGNATDICGCDKRSQVLCSVFSFLMTGAENNYHFSSQILNLLSWEHSLQMTEREETILPDVLLAIPLLISPATWKSIWFIKYYTLLFKIPYSRTARTAMLSSFVQFLSDKAIVK